MTAAITINYRKPDLTARCVESLLADGWAPVLVWDNSDDGGVSLKQLQVRFDGIRGVDLVASPKNLGFGAGMNRSLVHLGSSGYVGPVLLVNNDASVRPGLREELVPYLVACDEPLLLAPRIEQAGVELGWLYYQPWFAMVTKRPFWGSFHYLSGCCLLVNRADNAATLFDEDFFMYGEDVELSHRVVRDGGRLVLLDNVYVDHAGSASSGQSTAFYERSLVASHWLLARKLASSRAESVMMRVTRMPALVARALMRAVRYRSLTPLRALAFVVTAAPYCGER